MRNIRNLIFIFLFGFSSLLFAQDEDPWYGDDSKVENEWKKLKKEYRSRSDTTVKDKKRIDSLIEKRKAEREEVISLRDETDWGERREKKLLDLTKSLEGGMINYGKYVVNHTNPLRILDLTKAGAHAFEELKKYGELMDIHYKPMDLEWAAQDLSFEINSLENKRFKLNQEIESHKKEIDAIDKVLDAYEKEAIEFPETPKLKETKEVVFEFAKNVGNKKSELIKKYGAYCVEFGHDEDECGSEKRCFWVSDKRFGDKKFCLAKGQERDITLTPKALICGQCKTIPTAKCDNKDAISCD